MRIIIYTSLIFLLFTVTVLPQQPNFLPLEIGNEYQINNGISYFFGIIERDTVYPNGKTYFTLPRPIFEFDDTRVDEFGNIYTTVVPLTGITGTLDEYMIFKADAQDGEIWPVAWGLPVIDTLYAELIITETWYVFDRLRTIKAILLYANSGPPYVYVLAEGIGQIREDWDDGTTVLLNYAKVGGTVYGNIVGIDDDDNINNLAFSVSQNYPNPFNPSTVISYQLPVDSKVQLKVYDILGTEIGLLVNETKPAGKYEVSFDGSILSSGTYFYTLIADGLVQSKKMMLVK
ncbi:MAG: T9SS type A sorting domain-containing protein [Ignavibacterium sp.]|nr:T9SS type A sorting domain-containing protein [Ignavibacterium sp.]